MATTAPAPPLSALELKLQKAKTSKTAWVGTAVFGVMLVCGLAYIITKLSKDLAEVHSASVFPYLLLGVALLIALGFEFVNGFHDTANAVATVIYTHSLEPHLAVVWSGVWNFIGVITSSGAVAFSIVALLPVELILKVSKGSGFAMVFALLVAAILWNLATWWRGLPASSSHTMIGSILGVGIMNQIMQGRSGTSGVDWEQVTKVFKALLFSPLIGFVMAALIFGLFKLLLRDERLYKAPEGDDPPPFHIRALLILTCTGVSFFHGSNDGQKGMGLIMLILVGTVPTAYALNHTVDRGSVTTFAAVSTQVAGALHNYEDTDAVVGDSGQELERFVSSHDYQPATLVATEQMVIAIRNEAVSYGSLGNVPQDMQANVRNQMYLTSEALRLMAKSGPKMNDADKAAIGNYKGFLDKSTRFIPTWVKVAVALALGLGTMVGWKRIVITVGEKIGKTHLTYAQGAAAEITAMITIGLADGYGLPVSTTHVLSSGVAGTMAANKSGLQLSTIRDIAMAWVFTLPAAALLSAGLFWAFNAIAK
ncbi:phosphate/sulfate permease [Terriglobus roseus DSM 18391]|uniref:Phosphate transporter n=1 Tax=Terriglobus roseus (strain DSM 18391 / NRRL B-41598 / KBS 63) TaxID=926566 RepID=I3ZCR1_TERRK|nr:inorganic phosphate transporter [Terriglobus roseus]AFL87029.1 phosphate/sulfate permease [Terriglobus roseus DSM 18391]